VSDVANEKGETDGKKEGQSAEDLIEELFGPVIFSYTTEQAVEDGVLVPVGMYHLGDSAEQWPVYFTATLMAEGYQEDAQKRADLVYRGIRLLMTPDPEDSPTMHLRVIEPDEAWVIAEPGKLTYLRPEDY
jgi:hypothetical protein